MLEHLRAHWTKVMSPPAHLLLRLHVTPDMVTWAGTIGVVIVSLLFFPQGWLWQGAILVGVLVVSDSLDGIMARSSGQSSDWGAFLDSCLDRIADGAVFGGIALYYVGADANTLWATLAIAALIFGQVTSYTKARGEPLANTVSGGPAGRADRLLVGLIGVLLTGLGVSMALPVCLVLLAVAGAVTVGQRMVLVRRATRQKATADTGGAQ